MAQEEAFKKWLEIADRDLDAAEWLQQGGRWLYVAFECHQALEKYIKAFWCGTRNDDPPYLHDHWRLLEGCGLTEKIDDGQRRFIEYMKPMYIAARYPEHKQRIAATLNEENCKNIVEQTKQFREWLHQEYLAETKLFSLSDTTNEE